MLRQRVYMCSKYLMLFKTVSIFSILIAIIWSYWWVAQEGLAPTWDLKSESLSERMRKFSFHRATYATKNLSDDQTSYMANLESGKCQYFRQSWNPKLGPSVVQRILTSIKVTISSLKTIFLADNGIVNFDKLSS